ncbi:ATPase [Sesbania bispinosa]|nr:ATPase [Sesbania bispinosa]
MVQPRGSLWQGGTRLVTYRWVICHVLLEDGAVDKRWAGQRGVDGGIRPSLIVVQLLGVGVMSALVLMTCG